MKRGVIISFIMMLFSCAFAQKNVNIYKSDFTVNKFSSAQTDSIKVSEDRTTLGVYQGSELKASFAISEVDSMTFSEGTVVVDPVIGTSLISAVGVDFVTMGIDFKSVGSNSIVEKGICWSASATPTVADNKYVIEEGSATKCVDIMGLDADKIYYFRAYAKNDLGTVVYGQQLMAVTKNNLPVMQTTSQAYTASTQTARIVCRIVDKNNVAISEVGVCYSEKMDPTVDDIKVANRIVPSSSFTINITDMDPDKNYYVRAYAISEVGVSYGKSLRVVPMLGDVKYYFTGGANEANIGTESFNLLVEALDSACYYMSKYTGYVANIPVDYHSGVPSAEASFWGQMKWGANQRYMYVGTAMHEMCHYFGSGTQSKWNEFQAAGKGMPYTNAKLEELTAGRYKQLGMGGSHFWPFGCNQKEEVANEPAPYNNETYLMIMAKLLWEMRLDCNWRTK